MRAVQRRRRLAVGPVVGGLLLVALGSGGTLSSPASAQDALGSDWCLFTDPPEPTEPPHALRFGTTPLVAGNVGPSQGEPVPFEPERDVAGVVGLRPEGRELVMRLNRMFWADGEDGVRHYAAIVDRYAEEGFPSELQVRYHPPEGAEGDMEGWEDHVRLAVRILGERPSLTALSITNEANMDISGNTSDGGFDGVREAIVVGTLAARDELDRMGREDVQLGFSFAWRWLPNSDRAFWQELGELATPEFLAATDYVGLQVYPGLVWPPLPLPGRSAGEEVNEALTLLRGCYLPMAGLDDVDLWVTENGYATNLGRTEGAQDTSLRSTIEEVHALSGTLGVTDYRWFNLRDNRSDGLDLFDAVGLLRDDYSEKPAYATFRALLAEYGAAAAPWPQVAPGSPRPEGDLAAGGSAGDDAEHRSRPAGRSDEDGVDGAAPAATGAQLPATGGGGSAGLGLFALVASAALVGRRAGAGQGDLNARSRWSPPARRRRSGCPGSSAARDRSPHRR